MKALISSESGFRIDPKENTTAFGIAQITKQTFKTLQDPKGEAKDFIFSRFMLKDLKNPEIAMKKLKKEPSVEEIILEYKSLLKSNTPFKEKALERFRKDYAQLKK